MDLMVEYTILQFIVLIFTFYVGYIVGKLRATLIVVNEMLTAIKTKLEKD